MILKKKMDFSLLVVYDCPHTWLALWFIILPMHISIGVGDIGVAPIMQLCMCIIKIVTFKGGPLMQ